MMQAWKNFLLSLEPTFGKSTIRKWISPAKIVHFDAGNLFLEVNDSFQALWLEEHLLPKAKKHFVNSNQRTIKIHLSVKHHNDKPTPSIPIENKIPPIQFLPDRLNPYSTFEQFIPGTHNLVPYQILCKIAKYSSDTDASLLPLGTYNPIFLYGKSGSGKTHLMMATATLLQKQGYKVFYSKAETFTQHVIAAMRNGKMQECRKAYRHIDVLLVDDVEIFARKMATQEELFHTFNALHTHGKQIILSANIAPAFLQNIEARLISRFEWGLAIPLEKTTAFKELHAMLKKRIQFYHYPLKHDVIDFLIKTFPNAKSLSRSLETLNFKTHLHYAKNRNHLLSLSEIKELLHQLIEQESKEALTTDKILHIVSDNFGIDIEDIIGKSQVREFVLPRQIAMFLFRQELKMPYTKIGYIFSRDHSTVMSSIKNVKKYLDESRDKEVSSHLTDIQRKIVHF